MNPANMIMTKFIVDIFCNRYSTICITDENELFLWGKNIGLDTDQKEEMNYYDPFCIYKAEEHILSNSNDESTVLDKIFGIKDIGFLFITKLSNSFNVSKILFRTSIRGVWKLDDKKRFIW